MLIYVNLCCLFEFHGPWPPRFNFIDVAVVGSARTSQNQDEPRRCVRGPEWPWQEDSLWYRPDLPRQSWMMLDETLSIYQTCPWSTGQAEWPRWKRPRRAKSNQPATCIQRFGQTLGSGCWKKGLEQPVLYDSCFIHLIVEMYIREYQVA